MNLSWKAFTVFKIPIRLHISMLLILILAFTVDFGPVSRLLALSVALVISVMLFGSVLAHELGHALVARRYGVHTADIVLTPIGGMARMNRIPEAAGPEIAIAIAGPLVSFAIAAATWAMQSVPAFQRVEPLPQVAEILSVLNFKLALFNLIPAFPMDGGRIFRGLLSIRYGFLKATILAARIGRWMAIAGGIYGIWTSTWTLVVIAVFVYLFAGQELRAALIRDAAKRGVTGAPFGPFTAGFHVEYRSRSNVAPEKDWTADPEKSSAGVKVVENARVELIRKDP